MSERSGQRTIGRYAMCAEIAAGGMATVHLGKLLGPVGFSRIVAIKALAHKLARACYHMLREHKPFEITRCFG